MKKENIFIKVRTRETKEGIFLEIDPSQKINFVFPDKKKVKK